jgi:hypothetical protein
VPQPAKKDRWFVVSEIRQRLNDCVLSPALRVSFRGIVEKALERTGQVGDQFADPELRSDFRGLPGKIIVAVSDRFAEHGCVLRRDGLSAQFVEFRDLLLEFLHPSRCTIGRGSDHMFVSIRPHFAAFQRSKNKIDE